MKNIQDFLEKKLLTHDRVIKVFPLGPSLDTKKPQHMSFEFKKVEIGELYDSHECTITVKSDQEIQHSIVTQSVIAAMKQLEAPWAIDMLKKRPHIMKVIPLNPVYNKDRTEVSIGFTVVNNLERF